MNLRRTTLDALVYLTSCLLTLSLCGCLFQKDNNVATSKIDQPNPTAEMAKDQVQQAGFENPMTDNTSDDLGKRKTSSTSSDPSTKNSTIKKRQSLAESILFQPVKYPRGGYDKLFIEGQQVRFKSEDETQLEGRLFRAVNPKGIIVFCHGNGGNLASRADRMEQMKDRYGYSIFLFDYRGYGRSEGKPTVSGVLADGRAAVRKAAELAHIRPSEVIVMGRSLGGAVAVQLANSFDSQKLIVESSFTSFRDVARHHVSFLSGFARKNDLTSEKDIQNFSGRVLISHGTTDKVVPYEHGQKLFQAANDPKLFYEIKNGGHNDPLPESYLRVLGNFLSQP